MNRKIKIDSRDTKTASPHKLLVYFDGPQLWLLKTNSGLLALALKINEDEYFVCENNDRVILKYMTGKVDLNFVFRSSAKSKLYKADERRFTDEGDYILEKFHGEIPEHYYPEPGFFSRSHTESEEDSHFGNIATKIIKIDGKWEARDFSRFYARLADLYSIVIWSQENSLERKQIITPNKMEEDDSEDPIDPFKRTLDQGLDYAVMYNQFKEKAFDRYPLDVAGITYNSPGEIKFRGDNSALSSIIDNVFSIWDDKLKNPRTDYYKLYTQMKNAKLLGNSTSNSFYSPQDTENALKRADAILRAFNMEGLKNTIPSGPKASILYCKIALSIYRRFNDLRKFNEEGRTSVTTKT